MSSIGSALSCSSAHPLVATSAPVSRRIPRRLPRLSRQGLRFRAISNIYRDKANRELAAVQKIQTSLSQINGNRQPSKAALGLIKEAADITGQQTHQIVLRAAVTLLDSEDFVNSAIALLENSSRSLTQVADSANKVSKKLKN